MNWGTYKLVWKPITLEWSNGEVIITQEDGEKHRILEKFTYEEFKVLEEKKLTFWPLSSRYALEKIN